MECPSSPELVGVPLPPRCPAAILPDNPALEQAAPLGIYGCRIAEKLLVQGLRKPGVSCLEHIGIHASHPRKMLQSSFVRRIRRVRSPAPHQER